MSEEPLARIEAATVCANCNLSEPGRQLLRDGMSPREFVKALLDKKSYVDAIEFMAHVLPPREGIWWGCLCLQHACGDRLQSADRAAATAAVVWLMRPTEENRAAAGAQANPASSAGSLATAVFHTGGNVAPAGLNVFKEPEPFAPARFVATAVKLAAAKCDPAAISKTQWSYAELAIQIAADRYI